MNSMYLDWRLKITLVIDNNYIVCVIRKSKKGDFQYAPFPHLPGSLTYQ